MITKFKKLSPNAITPSYAKEGDAGLDISAITYTINKEHNFIEYHTGLAFEIPKGHVGLLFPRLNNLNFASSNLYFSDSIIPETISSM